MILDKVAGCHADCVATNCVPGNDFNFVEPSADLFQLKSLLDTQLKNW